MAVKNVIFRIEADTKGMRKDMSQMAKDVGRVDQSVKKAQSSMSKFGQTIQKAGNLLGGLFAVQQLLDFGKATIGVASDFEALTVSFETFLGSSEKAKVVMAELEQFSLKTPLTPEEVNQAGKVLLAFGVTTEKLIPSLKTIGDLSAGTGKNFNELAVIFGKAKVSGTLFAEDINQLTEAGIPIIDKFAKMLKVPTSEIKKMGSEGKLNFDLLEQAFIEMTGEGGKFKDLMVNLSKTTAGKMSTLAGEFTALQRSIGDTLLPTFNKLISIGSKIIDFIQKLPKFFNDNRKSIIGLGVAFASYNGLIQLNILRLKGLVVWGTLQNQAMTFGAYNMRRLTLGTKSLSVAQRVATVSTRAMTISFRALSKAIMSNPIGIIATVLTTLAVLFADVIFGIDEVNEGLEKNTKWTWDSVDATKEMNKVIAKETGAMEGLFAELKHSNTGQARRVELIKEINERYGEYLPKLLTEEANLKEVAKAYDLVKNAMLQKIAVQQQEEQIAKVFEEQFKSASEVEKKLKDAGIMTGMWMTSLQDVEDVMNLINKEGLKFKTMEMDEEGKITSLGGIVDSLGNSFDMTAMKNRKLADNLAYASLKSSQLISFWEEYTQVKEKDKGTIDEIINFYSQWINKSDDLIKTTGGNAKQITSLFNNLFKELQKLKQQVEQLDIKFADIDDIEKINKIKDAQIIALEKIMKERKRVASEKKQLDKTNMKLLDSILDEQIKLVVKKADEEVRKVRMKKMQTMIAIGEVERQQELVLVGQKIREQEELIARLKEEGKEEQAKKSEQALIKLLDQEKMIKVASIMDIHNTEVMLARQNADLVELANAKKKLALMKLDDDYLKHKKKIDEMIAKNEEEAKKQAIENIVKQTAQMVKELISLAIAEVDGQIDAQRDRIERARDLAEFGNAEQLQLEEERLVELNAKKQKFVQTQQALDLIMIISQSMLAIARAGAEGGALAPFTIASTLIALAIGIISAKAQAQSLAGGFAEGGYTGDGGKSDVAGVVHKGEYVISKDKTARNRNILDAIHTGRTLSPDLLSQKMVLVENKTMDLRLHSIEKAINKQNRMSVSIDEKGIHGIVSNLAYKSSRLKNRQSR